MSNDKLTARDMEIISKVFQCLVSPEAMKIDTEKLAGLAGFANGKSANNSWLNIKKKLLNGATFDANAVASTTKKAKGKAAVYGDGSDGEGDTSTVVVPKKRANSTKTESADAENEQADTEKTPSAETPKKSRAKKATATANTDATGEAASSTAPPEVVTPKPKRKRGPNKPKDPNAIPTKRAKKGAKASITTTSPGYDNNAAYAQPHGGNPIAQSVEGKSIFGGDAMVKPQKAKEEGGSRPLAAEDQGMAMPYTHPEGPVA